MACAVIFAGGCGATDTSIGAQNTTAADCPPVPCPQDSPFSFETCRCTPIESGDGGAAVCELGDATPSPDGCKDVTQFEGESFVAIAGTSDDDIWVVGHPATSSSSGGSNGGALLCPVDRSAEAFMRHYDGASWTRMDGIANKMLSDVWAASARDVWAVGLDGTVSHYDGAEWTQSDVRAVSDVGLSDPCHEVSLAAVWGSGPTDVWAVGYAYPSSAGPALVLHYNGSAWMRAEVTDVDGLFDVWGTSSADVWVAGSSGITQHFDGVTWSKVAGGTTLYRFGIWGAASNDVWAVGNGGSITHYDGTVWTLVREQGYEQFEAVWGATTNDIWIVGARSATGMPPEPLALHWDGRAWSEHVAVAPGGIADVWVSDSGQTWAVSADEIIRLH